MRGYPSLLGRVPLFCPLLLLLCALALGAPRPAPEPAAGSLTSLDIVHPVRVDATGTFLSFELWPHTVQKRAAPDLDSGLGPAPHTTPTFFQLRYRGRELRFNLSTNVWLLAPGFVLETRRTGGLGQAHIRPHTPACHLLGHVQDLQLEGGHAAISACDGLKGVFWLSDEDYFIEPLDGAPDQPGHAWPHVVYKHQNPERWAAQGDNQASRTCGVQVSPELERQQEDLEQPQPGKQQRQKRLYPGSVSKEKWVETLVVADTKMVEYHGQPQVENYVLTIMNMVAGLFHDPSIGNPIHITIVRLILLEDEEKDLKITHHADNTLRSFCKWQRNINMKGDAHPQHHDTAILLTRKDLCLAMNQPCETLGLSHVGGMCQLNNSCSISEDTGLPLAFTVAHELGHSFGMHHDGSGNDCEPVGKLHFIMSPQLLYDSAPLTWSRCSSEYITRFLDRGWGMCLDDPPTTDVIDFPSVPPGVLYDVDHQCHLQYGANSIFCEGVDNVCHTLWCSVGMTCHSKLDPAVDGTKCGPGKWCFNGDCVPMGFRPEPVDGGWSEWSAWSVCSRSCGMGVQIAERWCTQPEPKYKGRFCLGERRRMRLCNLQACPPGQPSFRHVQCSQFDSKPYKGQLHTWVPVFDYGNPCELNCRPSTEHFSEKLRDAVIDGTPCYQDQTIRDLCINGICKSVGCDFEIDSGAVEDRCGVCRGNGSTCHTVIGTFEEAEGQGYMDVWLIPMGARDIHIEEVADAANFLALRSSEDPPKYFLNGGWTIQWNGDYHVAGTTFTYTRTGNRENLTSPGPTSEPVWIQVLCLGAQHGVQKWEAPHTQKVGSTELVLGGGGPATTPASVSLGPKWPCGALPVGRWRGPHVLTGLPHLPQLLFQVYNPGVRYEYTVHRETENFNAILPPKFSWHHGPWSECTVTCGTGMQRQIVYCVEHQAGLVDERHCDPLTRPDDNHRTCSEEPCPARWWAGEWQHCSRSCGSKGISRRAVLCLQSVGMEEQSVLNLSACEHLPRPPAETPCNPNVPCPATWAVGNWSQCSVTCGNGTQQRITICTNDTGLPCDEANRPATEVPCAQQPCLNLLAPEASGSGASSPELFNEVDFISNSLVTWPLPNSTPESDSISNRIEDLNPPSPQWVDDFYYDYNFITFHEDLSYGSLEEPSPNLVGSVELMPPTQSSPDKHPMEPPKAEGGKQVAGHTPLPPLQQLPPNPVVPPLPEEDATMGTPDLGLPTSVRSAETPAAPASPNELLVREDSQTWPPPPQWNGANDISKDSEDAAGGRARHLPQSPSPMQPPWPPVYPTPIFPETDVVLLWTRTTSWDPAPERDPHGEMRPTTGVAVSSPLPTTHVPTTWEQDSPLTVPPTAEEGHPTDLSARNATWQVGNWSQCSTTCGLGAVWRAVYCSSGRDADCTPAGRPQPARHCHLRPCAAWYTGNWSKCSRGCGGGSAVRDVHCVNTQDLRPLRPFHCQPGPSKPPTRQSCGTQPCLSWYTSSWRECSEACGGGEQQRLVTCPEPGLCEETLRPNATQPCNTHPCTQWVVGPWGQCSAPCRGGVQRRLVKCVNLRTGLREEDSDQCSHEARPEGSRLCSAKDCEVTEPPRCERDRLSFNFCELLHNMGHCELPTVRVQCCHSCHPSNHKSLSHGHSQVAHR
ncbi:A disintegrin and metalloproteinase with thrombospondin motifs 7 isoform X2 [Octodon degus]|uniref:A disintegrin and metalloproteinase with thrombospondin motifs 7 n=1 Tax=Octodon degus TaxID=10160 RepID=A0A6P6E7S2_OCTDE|nr:A disintegrin and metalloproteinase with thrombospondin motifs 7 isoform X2 [Octodon degus]